MGKKKHPALICTWEFVAELFDPLNHTVDALDANHAHAHAPARIREKADYTGFSMYCTPAPLRLALVLREKRQRLFIHVPALASHGPILSARVAIESWRGHGR